MKLHEKLSNARDADIATWLESAYKEALEKDKVDLTHLARGLDTVTDLDGNSHPRRFGFVAADINKGLRYGIGYTWDGNPVYQSYSDHHLHRGRTGNPMMLHTAESPAELLDKVNKWHAAFLAKTPRYSVRTIGPSSSEIDRISFYETPAQAVSGLDNTDQRLCADIKLIDNHTNSVVGRWAWSEGNGEYRKEGIALYSAPLQQAAQSLGIENKAAQAPAAKISV